MDEKTRYKETAYILNKRQSFVQIKDKIYQPCSGKTYTTNNNPEKNNKFIALAKVFEASMRGAEDALNQWCECRALQDSGFF